MLIRYVFLFWYAVGLTLMLTIGVPEALAFSNGLFLVFFALYAFELERRSTFDAGGKGGRLLRVGLIFILTLALECLSVATGWPFGSYRYTEVLGVHVLGVPIAIAFAWVGVILVAALLSPARSRWTRALFVGLWTVLFDLVLDPVAYAREFWVWEHEGGYFGIPVTNFISWFLISASLSLLLPLRQASAKVRNESVRMAQLMLMMFGLLGWKEGLLLPLFIAIAGAAAAEGAILRHAKSQQKQAL